ncbi:MAG: HNH endonuclease [Oleispira sp.]|nr:HNH endonuclease [Oleispira sp.]MBL4879907.1 HNH endonuclease [Oleispira sp.]
MKKLVEKAFLDFDKGIRPEGHKPARNWFVINSSGRSYPAKAIWGLATNEASKNLHTNDARAGLSSLEYTVVNKNSIVQKSYSELDISKSQSDSSKKRLERLSNASKIPNINYSITANYVRNPDVVAEVLYRAKGVCEQCGNNAPFIRVKDGTPYLEVHHRVPLALGGEDTVKNALAVCPNCHRELHFGVQ